MPRFGRRGRVETEKLNEELLRSQRKRRFARRPRVRASSQREQRETAPMMEQTDQPAPQRWEFCQLIFASASEREGRWWADLSIYYIGEPNRSAALSSSDAEKGKSWATATGPWRAALASLGRGGWELVGVQHAGGGSLASTDAIAYLKRPVQAGRAVNSPEIAL